jgi:hypothetical protein
MKSQLNEVEKLQKLAGLLKERINESSVEIDKKINLLRQKKDLQKSDLLEIPFYHGTTLESWKTDESNDSYLFVIDEIEIAKNHALDRIESKDSNDKTAIVLQINIKDVIDLKWVEDDDLGTWPYKSWEESWKEVGSFVIVGNIPDKKFKVIWSKTF